MAEIDPAELEHLTADVGFDDVEVHQSAQPPRGYLGDRRRNRAHVIVRRRHVGRPFDDLGFERRPDDRYDETWLGRLTVRHAYRLTSARWPPRFRPCRGADRA